MKILTILGAIPQFIRDESVSRAIMSHNSEVKSKKLEVERIKEDTIHTRLAELGISTIEYAYLSYHYYLANKMLKYIITKVPVSVSNLLEIKRLVVNNIVEDLESTIDEALKIDRCKIKISLINFKNIYNWEEPKRRYLIFKRGYNV